MKEEYEWNGKIGSKQAEGKLKEMINNMKVDWNDYDRFIAECYEAEDEFWKGVYEDIEADTIISLEKENF